MAAVLPTTPNQPDSGWLTFADFDAALAECQQQDLTTAQQQVLDELAQFVRQKQQQALINPV